MPICEKCGTGLPVGYEYCFQCGHPVRGLPADDENARPGVLPPFPPAPGTADDAGPSGGLTPAPRLDAPATGASAAGVPGTSAPGYGTPGWSAPGWAFPGAQAPAAGVPVFGQTPALARTQVLATWGVRFLAAAIDYMIVSMTVAVVAMVVLSNRWGGEQNVLSHLTSSTGSATLIELDAAVICAFFVYCLIGEVAFQSTLGKRVLGLRVVAYGGARASLAAVVLRNVTKAMSCLFPLVGLPLALVMIGVDPNRQRIGDRLARTYVLRDVVTIVAPGAPR